MAFVLIAISIRIIPWNVVQLLEQYPIPQYIPFSKTVHINMGYGVTENQNVSGYVLLEAQGSISAVNPITVSVAIFTVGSGTPLATIMGLRWVVVDFFGSYQYPFTTFSGSQQDKWGEVNMTTNSQALSWISNRQTQIIYLLSGVYNATIVFYGTKPFWDNNAEVDLTNVITIASEQSTFGYVSEVSLLSLELVIVALMLVEIYKSEEKKNHEKHENEKERNDDSVTLPVAVIGLVIVGLYYAMTHNRKKPENKDK